MSMSVSVRAPRHSAWYWGTGAVTVALAMLVLGLLTTRAAAPLLLGDPGPVVRWGLPVAAVMSRLAAGLTVGAAIVCAAILPPGRDFRSCRDLCTGAASVWAVCQATEAVMAQLAAAGEPLGAMTTSRILQIMTVSGPQIVAALLAALVAVTTLFVASFVGAGVVLALTALALAPIAETGHAAGSVGHGTAVAAMWLHLVFIGIWAGGLAALLTATPSGERLRDAAPRYSAVAGWCFAVVAFSGLINTTLRVAGPGALLSTRWGQLLLLKLMLVAMLGIAGYVHRMRTLRDLRAASEQERAASAFRRLAGGELVLMGAVIGLSIVLGVSAPPLLPTQGGSNAAITLTGEPMPDPPSVLGYLTQWTLQPIMLLLPVAGCVVYMGWVRRLRRRGDAWPVLRTVSWVAGMVLFAWVAVGGPAVYGAVQFSVHMAQHLALITVLPIFYVLGMPVSLALRALPKRHDGSAGPREWLLAVLHSRWAQFLSRPVVTAVHVVLSMAVLYLTPLFELTLVEHWAHLLMVVHISLVGYLFVNVLIGRDPGPQRPPYGARLALLLPSMFFHTFFGLAVLSSTSLMAASFYSRLAVPWVPDPLLDQQIGGALTWAMGEIPAIALGLVIALRWTLDDQRAQDRAARRTQRPLLR